jgi:hypothetical protein
MLAQIQLKIPLFLYDTTWDADTVLEVEEELARRLVQLGQADLVTPMPPDPHQQHHQSATAPPPHEKATTRTEPPDKHHHKK